jgi:hypothetical protein
MVSKESFDGAFEVATDLALDWGWNSGAVGFRVVLGVLVRD